MFKIFRLNRSHRAAWIIIPLSVLMGDMICRWQGIPELVLDSPMFFLRSLSLSVLVWGGLSRIFAGSSRWRFAAVLPITASMAALVCASWQYSLATGGDPTLGTTMYLLSEPLNALSLLSVILSWKWGLFLIALIVTWTWALTRDPGPVRPSSRIGWAVLAVACFFVAGNTRLGTVAYGSPYLGDYNASQLLYKATKYLIVDTPQYAIKTTSRDLVDPQPPREVPNVLLVVNESLRRDHMHVFGHDRRNTPRLDAFFEQNSPQIYDFPRGFSGVANTYFAWTSILTGRYTAHKHGVLDDVPVAWQFASAVGYDTFLVSPQDWNWVNMKDNFLTFNPPDRWKTADRFDAPIVNDSGIDDRIATRAATEYLQRYAGGEQPFFGILQTNATHVPFLPDEEADWPLDTIVDDYDAAVMLVDRSFGMIIDSLRNTDSLKDTIIIFTSDHAEFMYGHTDVASVDTQERNTSCHPVVTHVPYFIYIPEIWQKKLNTTHLRANTQRVVSHVDVLPTLLEIWGLNESRFTDKPVPMDGESLLSPLPSDRLLWCFSWPPWWNLPNVGFAVYDENRMAYARADLKDARFMTSPDWVEEEKGPYWDVPTVEDRAWLSEKVANSELIAPYLNQFEEHNPSLAESLKQSP